MIIAELFDGDSIAIAREQHNCYNKALIIIRGECRRMAILSCEILEISVPKSIQYTGPIDHRSLQWAHDLLAAAWRYRSNAMQLTLAYSEANSIETEWLTWLENEIRSWQNWPHLISYTNKIIAYQNTDEGYRFENKLFLELFYRFHDVPWHESMQSLLKDIESKLSS